MRAALVAVAGAMGALSRYGIGMSVGVRTFPWATLAINITGSYLLGLLLTVGAERHWSENITVPLAVGFLGAYTTFSTFSYETQTLVRTHRASTALLYVLVSVLAGVLGAAAGYSTARALA
jgi:CrcB protein